MNYIIDPGHGGKDPGAVSGEYVEALLVEPVCVRLAELLGCGLTRRPGEYVGIRERAQIANERDAILISIHCNAAANPAARGWECFHYEDSIRSRRLCWAIRDAWREAFAWQPLRGREGVKPDTESARGRLGVLRLTRNEAALVELGFLTNPHEAEFIKSQPDQIAAALASGINRYSP